MLEQNKRVKKQEAMQSGMGTLIWRHGTQGHSATCTSESGAEGPPWGEPRNQGISE